ncbi:MAG: hypothetical protein COW89_06075 [Nitrospinae bacterium CG22_combo_CG10-13_8_21_14_all_47_10]|nr:MAG: hypothetical protein COW89_06075 [Nitrospinae bacterium CG22_combo_CG10-13_8_21_14_all_47_10]
MHKSEKLGSEMLRQAQHDEKEPFCHSEEQHDEESRGCAKVSVRRAGKNIRTTGRFAGTK